MNDRERNQSGQEQAVKQFLWDFLDKTKDEQTLNRILQDVGGYYDADRAYIFEMDKDNTVSITASSQICFFFLGPLGFDSGRLMTPFRKWVSSNLPKKTNNPNPSPTGKTRFGLYWFGAGDRTRLHYGVGVVQPPPKDSPPGCPISMGSIPPRYQESRYPVRVSAFLVPVTGLEPVRHRWRWILSFARYLELGVL